MGKIYQYWPQQSVSSVHNCWDELYKVAEMHNPCMDK